MTDAFCKSYLQGHVEKRSSSACSKPSFPCLTGRCLAQSAAYLGSRVGRKAMVTLMAGCFCYPAVQPAPELR